MQNSQSSRLFRGSDFVWTNGIGTIEASDVAWPSETGLDGFSVVSHKTGMVKEFFYAGKHLTFDGDVAYWFYMSTDAQTEIRIYND